MKLNIQLFAHTNATTNYELPQFIGTDKPTWLGDFNEAMADIDAGMHENASDIATMQTAVSTATSTASQASQDVSTLTTTVNSLSGTVSGVQTTANNASQTASSALNTANTANGKADTNATNITSLTSRVTTAEENIAKVNLTSFSTPTLSTSGASFTLASGSSVTVATNSDGSLAKIYGMVTATNVQGDGIVSLQSSLRPETDITINPHGPKIFYRDGSDGAKIMYGIGSGNITIRTTGVIEIPVGWSHAMGDTCRVILNDSLLFIKDFGDTPSDD